MKMVVVRESWGNHEAVWQEVGDKGVRVPVPALESPDEPHAPELFLVTSGLLRPQYWRKVDHLHQPGHRGPWSEGHRWLFAPA